MIAPISALFIWILPIQALDFGAHLAITLMNLSAIVFALVSFRSWNSQARKNVDQYFAEHQGRDLVESELASSKPGKLSLHLTNQFLRKQVGISLSLWLVNSILVTSLLVIPSGWTVQLSCFFVIVAFFQIPTYGGNLRWMQKCLIRNKGRFEQELRLS